MAWWVLPQWFIWSDCVGEDFVQINVSIFFIRLKPQFFIVWNIWILDILIFGGSHWKWRHWYRRHPNKGIGAWPCCCVRCICYYFCRCIKCVLMMKLCRIVRWGTDQTSMDNYFSGTWVMVFYGTGGSVDERFIFLFDFNFSTFILMKWLPHFVLSIGKIVSFDKSESNPLYWVIQIPHI